MANKAQVTGHMTISGSHKLNMAVKDKVLEAKEGFARKFRKVLLDPETNEEVVISGTARIGGLDKKTGAPIAGRKNSLTCYVAFKLKNVESFLAPVEEKSAEKADDEELEAMVADLGLQV